MSELVLRENQKILVVSTQTGCLRELFQVMCLKAVTQVF